MNYQSGFSDAKNSVLPKNVLQVIISAEVIQLKSTKKVLHVLLLDDPSENSKRRLFLYDCKKHYFARNKRISFQ